MSRSSFDTLESNSFQSCFQNVLGPKHRNHKTKLLQDSCDIQLAILCDIAVLPCHRSYTPLLVLNPRQLRSAAWGALVPLAVSIDRDSLVVFLDQSPDQESDTSML